MMFWHDFLLVLILPHFIIFSKANFYFTFVYHDDFESIEVDLVMVGEADENEREKVIEHRMLGDVDVCDRRNILYWNIYAYICQIPLNWFKTCGRSPYKLKFYVIRNILPQNYYLKYLKVKSDQPQYLTTNKQRIHTQPNTKIKSFC